MDFVHSRAAELFADCDLEDSDQEEIELSNYAYMSVRREMDQFLSNPVLFKILFERRK